MVIMQKISNYLVYYKGFMGTKVHVMVRDRDKVNEVILQKFVRI